MDLEDKFLCVIGGIISGAAFVALWALAMISYLLVTRANSTPYWCTLVAFFGGIGFWIAGSIAVYVYKKRTGW